MTNDQKIDVLTRMRKLLSDPDRVVLDPNNLFETAEGTMGWGHDAIKDPHCRVCFIGSAYVALGTVDDEARIEEILGATDAQLDSREIWSHTDALKQGRAVEVVDACLEDLRSVTA